MDSFFYLSRKEKKINRKKKNTQLSQHHHVKAGVVAKNSFRIQARKGPAFPRKFLLPRNEKRLNFSKGSNFMHAHESILIPDLAEVGSLQTL